ncbi:tetratricopeptide repeat protein [Salegentibacter chungangensis]|uniref:Tetratricopeptide repeat protein n=1 Tax=Salegentibacter chungangensis TaxID=1335724 RepID=A0ABW3NQ66_9FLAO
MKKTFIIAIALSGCSWLSPGIFAQEKEAISKEVNQDDLGNVTDAFQENFFEALKQKGIENYEKAITALETCRKLEPENAVVYFELGKNYKALENYDLAVDNFEKARKLDPKREVILTELFKTHREAGDFPKAITIIEELINLDSSYTEDLANLYMLSEQYDKALKVLDELDKKEGNSSYRNTMRRQIYARTNNTDAQIERLEEDISRDPENEQNYLNLIYIYSEQRNEEEAFKAAKELLEINPGSQLVHLALYKFYLNNKQPKEAVNSMMIVFESEEIDTDSKYRVLNDFLLFVNDHPEFQEDLMKVSRKLSEWENAPRLYEQLGQYYIKSDKKEDALKYFELGLEENPGNFDLLKNSLLLQLEFGKYEAAAKLSASALEIFPAQPMVYLLRGVALNKLQQYKEAEEILTFGLDYLIDDKKIELDFYTQLAISYQGLQNEEKAKEFQQKAENLIKELN